MDNFYFQTKSPEKKDGLMKIYKFCKTYEYKKYSTFVALFYYCVFYDAEHWDESILDTAAKICIYIVHDMIDDVNKPCIAFKKICRHLGTVLRYILDFVAHDDPLKCIEKDYSTMDYIDHLCQLKIKRLQRRIQQKYFKLDFDTGILLGKGSYGVVSACKHKLTNREYASKYVKTDRGEDLLVLREIFAMQWLSDLPGVVPLKYVYIDNHLGINMVTSIATCTIHDLLTSSRKRKLRNEIPFDLVQKKKFLLRIAETMYDSHKRNILHRDLCPNNILIYFNKKTEEWDVWITDWGLSRYISMRDNDFVSTYIVTLPYRCPEILTQSPVDISTVRAIDCWSFGVMAYEMLLEKQFPCAVSKGTEELSFSDLSLKQYNLLKKFRFDSKINDIPGAYEFVKHLLDWNPKHRMTMKQAKTSDFLQT